MEFKPKFEERECWKIRILTFKKYREFKSINLVGINYTRYYAFVICKFIKYNFKLTILIKK